MTVARGPGLGLNPADLRLGAVILAVALLAWAPLGWRLGGGPPDTDPERKFFVVTTPEGRVVLPADRDACHVVTGPLGKTVVQVVDGRARIAASPCPDPACHAGWVDRPGERRVCLPNRVVVEMVTRSGGKAAPGGGSDTEAYDAETH